MAEKPRLKKSDEILGSIATERAKRTGGRAQGKPEEQDRKQDPKPKAFENDLPEEENELTDGPALPSAQSLAEKLLQKKSIGTGSFKSFEFDEPARTAKPAEVSVPAPKPQTKSQPKPSTAAKAAPARTAVEFAAPAASAAPTSAAVEFSAAPAPAKPAAIEFSAADTFDFTPSQKFEPAQPPPASREPARKAQAPAQAPPPSQTFEVRPTVAEYTFQSFEEQKDAGTAAPVWEFSADSREESATRGEQSATRAKRRDGEPRQEQRRETQSQAEQHSRQQPEQRRERIIQPLKPEPAAVPAREQERAYAPSPPPVPEPAYTPPPPPPPEPRVSEEERSRQDFLKRIANQFEVQFEERFGEGMLNRNVPEPTPRRERPREPLFAPEPKLNNPPEEKPSGMQLQEPGDDHLEGEDFLTYVQRQERERQRNQGMAMAEERKPVREKGPEIRKEDEPALDFIEKFQKDVRDEEHRRSEDFKETLSQKFMRERERYLKELDIEPDEPDGPVSAAEPAPAQRRKLDFQIQPEMHMQAGEAPPKPRPPAGLNAAAGPIAAAGLNASAGPVTYTRGGTARPQSDDSGDENVAAGLSAAAVAAAGGKKTGEQLLLEHGIRTRTQSGTSQTGQPAKLKFTFATPEEQRQAIKKEEKKSLLPAEKWPRRVVISSMVVGLFALGLMIWPLASYYNLNKPLLTPEALPSDVLPETADILDVYNDRVFTQTATANSVIFKNAGTLLKNINVKDYVVIEDVGGTGAIRLEDVSVDSAISVKASGVDTLDLHNVKSTRLIINNPRAGMSVNVTGSSDIGIVELRTKSTVRQADIGTGFEGVRGVVVTAAEQGGDVEARLNGLNLSTLSAEARNTVLAFENGTRAENMSVDGSLSLSGDGKVTNLAIGSKTGQGAGDLDERKDVTLFVKDVSISNINVKSSAILNLASAVDSITTSDTITLGGGASVGTLTLNPKAGSTARLLVDIVSANVQSVYSNAQSRISITGASRVNELIADESTYALGNKVNHLKVNSDGVIYENEPDKITLSSGIRPPQSKADNPNIDFSLSTPQPTVTDTTGEDFATTCGHSRESGGFLLGDGSKDSPYEVSTPMQLAHVASHLSSHFLQTADVDISTESAVASNFPCIGAAGAPFEGVYDGGSFAIARIRIVSQDENVGLFGANKGIIRNVRVYSGEITSASASPSFVGGIAGLNYDGGQIRSCANGAAITGNQNARTGGIAGGNYGGRIHDCYNYAKVSGVDVVGGIVGLIRQVGGVTGSYNVGTIDGRDMVGAVVGRNEDGTVANCYFLMNTANDGIGEGSGTATERTAQEMQSPQMAADLSAGNEDSLWTAGSSTGNYRFPVHRKPQ